FAADQQSVAEGPVSFSLSSDDGRLLFLDGQLVIDNYGGPPTVTQTASLTLLRGYHDIRVEYFENFGAIALVSLAWDPTGGTSYAVIPAANLGKGDAGPGAPGSACAL